MIAELVVTWRKHRCLVTQQCLIMFLTHFMKRFMANRSRVMKLIVKTWQILPIQEQMNGILITNSKVCKKIKRLLINITMKILHMNSKMIYGSQQNSLKLQETSQTKWKMLAPIEVSVSKETKVVDFHLKVMKAENFRDLLVMKEKLSMVDLLNDQTGHGSYVFEVVAVLLSVDDSWLQLRIVALTICNWVFLSQLVQNIEVISEG